MIQEDLTAMVQAALPAVPIYPLVAKQNTPVPYIVYQRVISPVENVLAGNGNPPINQTRMQLDVFSNTYASVQSTAAALRAAMKAWSVQNISQGEQDFYEPETRLHRVLMDYSMWHYD